MERVDVIQEYLHRKRLDVIKRHLNGRTPDLDLGAGKNPKAEISLDLVAAFKPDIVADAQYLPFRNEAINSIICSHLIEHLNDLDRAMVEIGRILKKNGILFLFLPDDGSKLWRLIRPFWTLYYEKNVSESSPRTHVRILKYDDFRQLVRKFFVPVEMNKMNLGMEMYAVCKRH